MKVVVAGGGAAGMMAAIAAAENGHLVTLIEKNEKLGKKLFITGKGRCNFTNDSDPEELISHVISNPKFLYSAFYGFDARAVLDFFSENGLPYKIERGNRAFPRSDHSSDVIKTLTGRMSALGVTVCLETKLTGLLIEQDTLKGVLTDRGPVEADAVILALGGKSYPRCGACGDAWKILKPYGISLRAPEASLVPLVCADEDIPDLQGLSLKNVEVRILKDQKKVYEGFGEMLFTHFGLSGPLILSGSCYLSEADYKKDIRVVIDLKPALSGQELDQRILRDFQEQSNRQFQNALSKLLPAKLIPVIVKRSGIDPAKVVNTITKAERMRLLELLKQLTFTVIGNRGFDEAIITRGGVDVGEIDPATMAVKKIPGLYVAGEMIDTDALTGGFNLQIAWSTGHLAGRSI
ncbi:MAG: NAD(P)/FAD-dependent oxidoreductase [Lachnospiraceae bacterium]|nr:NAD(P)/FAD-dependent oxidoreductase [Lachnospiraceae bacterium]